MERYKYPRTFHLPYSEKRGSDDKTLIDDTIFKNKKVVVMEKYDGENTTIYKDYLHARSITSSTDESHRWLDRLRQQIAFQLPPHWRICGENMFYKHSVFYEDLPSMFLAYSIWNEKNQSLNWIDTKDLFQQLSLSHPTLIYEGVYNKDVILKTFENYKLEKNRVVEGFVVRLEESFAYTDFANSVAKFVAKEFSIDTPLHWRNAPKIYNQLTTNRHVWEQFT